MRCILAISFLFYFLQLEAQNLITNGELDGGSTANFFSMLNWDRFSGTPDVYTPANNWGSGAAMGGHQPQSGTGYVGFYQYGYWGGQLDLYEREYIIGGIDQPLQAGRAYQLEYYVRPGIYDAAQISYAIDQIGALFTADVPVPDYQNIFTETPQVHNGGTLLSDLTQWTKVSGCFIAGGGEQFITIGNFQKDEQTNAQPLPGATQPNLAYYFLDNVSLVEIVFPDLPADTSLCTGDSFVVGLAHPEATYVWSDGSTGESLTIDSPGMKFVDITIGECTLRRDIQVQEMLSPEQLPLEELSICEGESVMLPIEYELLSVLWSNGSSENSIRVDQAGQYLAEKTNNCGMATDTFRLELEDCSCHLWLPNSFTPDADGINDQFGPVVSCSLVEYDFQIFDGWGQTLFATSDPTKKWNGGGGSDFYVGPNVYSWTLQYRTENEPARTIRQQGSVNVVR